MDQAKYTKEHIYDVLLEDIVSLRYKPNEFIKENELAERFRMSRTPVREVIKRLALEGYIKITPRHGNAVTRIDIQHVRQMMQLRIVLESKVLSILTNTDDLNTLHLHNLLDEQALLIAGGDLSDDFWHSDNLFHKAIFELADRGIWWQLLERFEPHYMRYRKLDISDSNKVELLFVHHKNILRIIEEKRLIEIEDILKSHIYCCIDRIPFLIDKYPGFFCGI